MGLEPTTPALQRRCSSQLSYVPGVGATLAAGGWTGPCGLPWAEGG